MKECACEIALPLQLIFQKSFESGSVPRDWRLANITPIFKKGKRNDRGNYRPVSLTSVPCKVMESVVKDAMMEYYTEKSSLSPNRHGFTRGRSCLTNLLETFEAWTRILDEGYGLDVIFLDYRKAFDTVPHSRLLEKLRLSGVGGKLLTWIKAFLSDRNMRVSVNGSLSAWVEVLSGVPQGSVLGPLLFLIFVNDLPLWIVNSIKMFADDTKMWKVISKAEDSDQLQQDLCKLANWSDKWLLRFNPEKCKVVHIGQWAFASCPVLHGRPGSVTATSDNNRRERSRNIHNRRPETEQTVCPSFSEGHVGPGNDQKKLSTDYSPRFQDTVRHLYPASS